MSPMHCNIMRATVVCFLAAIYNGSATATPFSKCAFTGALLDIRLNECNELPCPLVIGSKAHMEVDFQAVWGLSHMTSIVYGLHDNIPVFVHENQKVCQALLTGVCPAASGATLSYSTAFSISRTIPELSITVEWQIRDQSQQIVFCAQIPAYLTGGGDHHHSLVIFG